MDFQAVNMDAAENALRLIGGDQLVAMITATYEAIHRAELRGQQDGFKEGHAIGMIDGRAQAEQEILGHVETAKVNAHVEGFDYAEDFPEVYGDEQPSDEGLAGLNDGGF